MALSTQRASASLTSDESTPPRWKHDVFLSFRGADTRRGFLSHLYHQLHYWQAMKIFKDDRDLEVGATISLELLTAMEQSHLAIIVLSLNYASSTWCLDELSKILECMQDTQRILPIFYEVDPSDVRNQRGSFAEAFTKHEERFSGDAEKLNRWRAALRKVGNLSGLRSKTYKSEAELIEDIVKHVWKKVNPTFALLDSEEKLVGFDFALDQLCLHLAPEENDVRFIGIWGMGGVGKTTLANLVFQKISHHFEHFCFLSNVRKGKISDLQGLLLSSIMKGNDIHVVSDEREGTFFIKNRLWNKKVLLVVDDVDQLNQLEKLVGEKNWFGVGSRIIITTRNERLLELHDIAIRYKVEVLKNDEALELFSRHAFKKDQPEKSFQKLSQEFLNYANGLPLALKTLGRSLYRRGQDAWESVLHNLRKIHDPDIFDSLKISYYGLTEIEKKIFLHVACLHRGKHKEQVIQILDWIFVISSHIEIDILIEKSLLTIESNIVEMHDLIQEMAWTIVREQSSEPGKRSLLWHHNDISHVLMNNKGTEAIEGIVLGLPELEVVRWNCTEAFNEIHGLKLLHFDNAVFSSGPKFLPNSLRIIRWSRYPSKSLPSSFKPHLLAKLDMRHSKLVQLWDGTQDFPKLKYVNLSYSEKLTSIPDFTRIPNLKELDLDGCKKLGEVHSSIAVHKKLKVLRLWGCKSIKSLPNELEMDSLEILSLWGCSNVNKVPEFGEQMKNLSALSLSETAIEQIPSSIERLVGLEFLYISNCKSLLGLPSAICNLKSLKFLYGYMDSLRFLRSLDVSDCNIGDCSSHRFSFEACYGSYGGRLNRQTNSIIKKCGARLVYEKDLEKFSRILKIPKLALPQAYSDEEAGPIPIGSSGSGSSDEIMHQVRPKRKMDGSCNHRFSFEAFYKSQGPWNRQLKTNSSIKKCWACLVYEKGSEEFRRILKIPNPALPQAYSDEEAGPVILESLCSLTSLDLSDCNISEGVIPDNIGYLPSLERLNLGGNNFVSLPASIRFLSNLWHLDLRRCERLEQLPDVPPKRSFLRVLVNDCVVLKRLSNPSKLSEGANVYDFDFSCLNCFRLVEEEDWINRIFAMIMRLATPRIYRHCPSIVWPGSEIPDWFDNRSAGDSITVELPLPPQASGSNDWVGIAFCVALCVGYDIFQIKNIWKIPFSPCQTSGPGLLKSQHLWVFYLTRDCIKRQVRPKRKRDGACSYRFSFEAFYDSKGGPLNRQLKTDSSTKKCGARLVYDKDLEEFRRILKIPKPALLQAYSDEEAGPIPIDSSGSGSSDDDDEPGIGSADEDHEPISKRFNKV